MVEATLIDLKAQYELIYLIADSTGQEEATAPISPKNFLKCGVQHIFCSPQALFAESLLKSLLQTSQMEVIIS